ncbi:MAG: 4Fe-4S dicluster domain-containing protein [Candidatus Cryptobacteroides sp.]|nr:4Fe-4S dicluster domain-containing protein [Candidatus Cryptobacteroides sp.]
MLRIIRITLAAICFVAVTLLFLDFTGTLHLWFGWLAKIQFLPAVLALNFVVIAILLVLTLLFGRIYCSVICPLGIFQDCVSNLSSRRKGKKARFSYSKEIKWLRYGVLVLFVIALVAGLNALVALLAPYSAYGRMVQSLLAPVWQWGNNLLAWIAERQDSYAFVTKDVWLKSLPTLIVAAVTFVVVVVLAWRNGRTYCNTICPVGTTLSFFSRFAMFRPVIDKSKCKSCHACERKCKAACIDVDNHKIDYSRCVDCFDCIDSCRLGALKYRFAWGRGVGSGSTGAKTPQNAPVGSKMTSNESKNGQNRSSAAPTPVAEPVVRHGSPTAEVTDNGKGVSTIDATSPVAEPVEATDKGRRAFLVGGAAVIGGSLLSSIPMRAEEEEIKDKKRDGGFAEVLPKKAPNRKTPITPFGSESVEKFYKHCTACQLCVTVCPNNVLRPSSRLEHLMQPEMSFEKGYCRPECVKCSEVCPAGAILKITPEEKTEWKVGTAGVDYDLCVVNRDGVSCGNCAHHCPVGAIRMVRKNPNDEKSPRIPSVNEEKCIGCGACENLCPSRPISAITVNGYSVHHNV